MFDAEPEGWHSGFVGDLISEVVDRIDPGQIGSRDLPYVGLEHIEQGTGRLSGVGRASEVVSQKSRFGAGDILYGKLRPNLRKVARPDFDGVCSTDIVVFRAKAGADVDFAFQLLQSEPLVAHAVASSAGTKMPRTHARSILTFQVATPPLDEQRQIAGVLRSVDEARTTAGAALSQTVEARAHQLERLMALPGEMRPLAHVCRLGGGYGFPIKHQGKRDGAYPFAKVSDMNRRGNETELGTAENYVDADDLKVLRAKPFPPGTTFFPKVGATLLTNKRRIASREIIVDNNVMGAVPTNIDPWFLFYAFNTIDMADYVQPGAVPSVNQGTVGKIMIPVPSREVQEQYVGTMRDLDRAIKAHRETISTLRDTKTAVAADLLSGRVRVPA